MSSDAEIIAELLKLHQSGLSWSQIADLEPYRKLGKSNNARRARLHDYAVKGNPISNPKHRAILGLSAIGHAPVCHKCGEIHYDNDGLCPETRAAKKKEKATQSAKRWAKSKLSDQPKEYLLWSLRNRKEVTNG